MEFAIYIKIADMENIPEKVALEYGSNRSKKVSHTNTGGMNVLVRRMNKFNTSETK